MSTSVQRSSDRLRVLRLRAGFSQRSLALAAGVAPNTIRNAENGVVLRPELQHRVVNALNLWLDEPLSIFDLWPLVDEDHAA
jgi:transcriptional regulator with XRE-family HTH domain